MRAHACGVRMETCPYPVLQGLCPTFVGRGLSLACLSRSLWARAGPQAGTNAALWTPRAPRASWVLRAGDPQSKAEAPGPGLGASWGCEFSLASARRQGGSRVAAGGGHSYIPRAARDSGSLEEGGLCSMRESSAFLTRSWEGTETTVA